MTALKEAATTALMAIVEVRSHPFSKELETCDMFRRSCQICIASSWMPADWPCFSSAVSDALHMLHVYCCCSNTFRGSWMKRACKPMNHLTLQTLLTGVDLNLLNEHGIAGGSNNSNSHGSDGSAFISSCRNNDPVTLIRQSRSCHVCITLIMAPYCPTWLPEMC